MLTLFRGNSAFFWRCVMLTRDTRAKLPCWALMSNLRYLFATAWGVSRSISNDAKHHSTGRWRRQDAAPHHGNVQDLAIVPGRVSISG